MKNWYQEFNEYCLQIRRFTVLDSPRCIYSRFITLLLNMSDYILLTKSKKENHHYHQQHNLSKQLWDCSEQLSNSQTTP